METTVAPQTTLIMPRPDAAGEGRFVVVEGLFHELEERVGR